MIYPLLLGIMATAGAIYPEGHFENSIKLTKANFDEVVKSQVDSGKTFFAPAWNAIVKEFSESSDVSFGDINLSEEQIRGNHNPGMGGWPTIRYFNKEHPTGAPYVKKTGDAMCTELGPQGGTNKYMRAYVEEAGETSLCAAKVAIEELSELCTAKELKYYKKFSEKPLSDIEAQIERLKGMKAGRMKESLRQWIIQRIALLKVLRGALREALQAAKEEL